MFAKAGANLQSLYKDPFYHKLMQEVSDVNEKQVEHFKKSGGTA